MYSILVILLGERDLYQLLSMVSTSIQYITGIYQRNNNWCMDGGVTACGPGYPCPPRGAVSHWAVCG